MPASLQHSLLAYVLAGLLVCLDFPSVIIPSHSQFLSYLIDALFHTLPAVLQHSPFATYSTPFPSSQCSRSFDSFRNQSINGSPDFDALLTDLKNQAPNSHTYVYETYIYLFTYMCFPICANIRDPEGGCYVPMKVAVARSSMGKQQLQEMEPEMESEMEPCRKLLRSAHDDVDDKQDPIALPLKRFNRICVFCGSSRGKKGIFSDVAFSLGQELVSRGIDLVYGGGGNGLMGQVAQTVHDGGGHVVGVIPTALIGQEISGQTIGKLVAVSDMHQRKAEMARQADAFIALPGGYGTLEELLEVITWSQLGIHEKPVGLLNVDGYYNPLLALFDKALEEGFLKFPARSIVVSAGTPSELLDKLEAYTPIQDPRVPKLRWEDAERLVYGPAVSNTAQ